MYIYLLNTQMSLQPFLTSSWKRYISISYTFAYLKAFSHYFVFFQTEKFDFVLTQKTKTSVMDMIKLYRHLGVCLYDKRNINKEMQRRILI